MCAGRLGVMGIFNRTRNPYAAQTSIVAAFASEAEMATIMARAESWARRTMREAGVDPVKESVRAVKVLRDAKPELGLGEAVALAKLGS